MGIACGRRRKFTAELQLYSGRTIDVPSMFIGGKSDWGVYQTPGDVEKMQRDGVHADAGRSFGGGVGALDSAGAAGGGGATADGFSAGQGAACGEGLIANAYGAAYAYAYADGNRLRGALWYAAWRLVTGYWRGA